MVHASFAADATCVLGALGVERADVYGTSLGGRVAQWLAIDQPRLVRPLVLACTTPGGPHATDRGPVVRRALAEPDPGARVRSLLDLMYTPAWHQPGRHSHLLGDPTMSQRAQHRHLRASNDHDATQRLHEITAPTLILHGQHDLMSPVENAELLLDHIDDARLSVTPEGRHGFFDEFRGDVSPAVTAFLADDGGDC